MTLEIQRPSGVNVGVNNPGDTIYIKGNESTDGSLRIIADASGAFGVMEQRVSGIWVIADLQTSLATHVIDDILGELVLDQFGEAVFEG